MDLGKSALSWIQRLKFRPQKLALFFFTFSFLVSAPAASALSPKYAIEVWQTDKGLPQNSVTAVFQGSDGYIYAGTYNGMVRFDGVHFVVYDAVNTPTLKNSRVTSLYQDSAGIVWIGHETGEMSLMERGSFRGIDLGPNWPGDQIVGLGEDEEGSMWGVNRGGLLVRLRDQKIVQPLPSVITTPPGAPSLVRAKDGKLWMTYRGVAGFFEHGELQPFRFGATEQTAYFENLCACRDGGLWVAGEGLLRKWNGASWTRNLGPFPWGQASVTAMLETSAGQLLVGTLDSGIYIIDPAGEVSHVSRTNGLPHDWVRSMAEDQEGNIWVGSGGGGLCVLRERKVAMFSPPDDWEGRLVLSVSRGNGDSIWASTEGGGVYHFSGGQWTHFDSSSGISNLFVWSVLEDSHSNVWVGTWQGGLYLKTAARFEPAPGMENFSLPITALMENQDGSLLAGTVAGLLRYENGKMQWLTKSEHPPMPDIRALAQEPDGTIWFGMNAGGGLGRFHNGQVTIFRKPDGLASNFILCLYLEPDHTLWIGTLDHGLCRLKDGKFTTFDSKCGLANDVVCSIADDGLGNLWMSSQNGIFQVSKSDLNAFADGKRPSVQCLVYGTRQGLATLACNGGFQPVVCHTADGSIWFPTGKGLAVVNPRELHSNTVKPPVWIENALVDTKLTPIVHNTDGDTLTVKPGQQRLQFEFTALSFTSPERVQFRYKLEQLEKEWIPGENHREANYSYLQPGDYSFRVIACNSDGLWNEQGAVVAVKVLPHFWQTLWFRVLAYLSTVSFAAGTVLLVTRRRLQLKLERLERQRALERERARIAKDIHDDLGASLTQITMLSQTVSTELQRPQQAAQHLAQIFNAARASTHALDEIVWAVNPKHDSLDSMATYLVKFAQDFLSPATIRCRLEMPLQLPAWALTSEIRHNLFLAYKEALNNVVKHAAATEVRIALVVLRDAFVLSVADDGKGFKWQPDLSNPVKEPERLGGGNGLENMHRRLEEIGGSLEVETAPGKGTKVSFFVRIQD